MKILLAIALSVILISNADEPSIGNQIDEIFSEFDLAIVVLINFRDYDTKGYVEKSVDIFINKN